MGWGARIAPRYAADMLARLPAGGSGNTIIGDIMAMGLTRRRFGSAAGALAAGLLVPDSLFAQQTGAPRGEPITIGFSMALTGSLAVNGKSGLLATQIWAEDVNAKGGLLG